MPIKAICLEFAIYGIILKMNPILKKVVLTLWEVE